MKQIASQGEFGSRFILIDTTMETTTESVTIDGRGLTLVGLELPALTGVAGTANILEVPTFSTQTPVALCDATGTDIAITLPAANTIRVYRWSPTLFPSVGKIRLKLNTKTLAAGTTIGFLFIKPQGER